ncbi:MAG: type II toxin-antitoxin system RelB/DinJ family antitoxin [Oscillospiraceae bacterium]|nr:type II toxin-antitoxin system RelB/DinJ family antitoxin [Oscillospiraceae bacterium]
MKSANYNIRLDPKIKSKAESTFATLGLNLSEAINVFLHKSILVHGFPFDVRHNPNERTIKAMQESEDILEGKIKTKSFNSTEDLFDSWAAEDSEEYSCE